MALDFVETGEDLPVQAGQSQRNVNTLPEGVSNGMLYKDIVRIAWPSLVEFTLTQVASMLDMIMVGQLGPWAITAVGLTIQPKFLLMTMFMSLNVGATSMVARYKGAGDVEKANTILRQAFMLTFVTSVIMSMLGFVFAEPLIIFMGATDAESLAGGTVYLQIQMAGFLFLALAATVTAVLRGAGDSRTAMIYNLIANVVGLVFKYLLIYGHFGFPRMEVAGASLATVIGQLVAFVLAMIAIMGGNNFLHLRIRDGFKPDREAIGQIVKIGLPAMAEQLVMRAGMIIYAKTVAGLGTISYATHNICMNIQALSFMIGQAFAISATALVGQSLGKKRPDMAHHYASRTRRIGMCISVLLGVIFFIGGRFIVGLYSDDTTIIDLGGSIMMLMALTLPLQSSQFILSGALRGAGDTRTTAVITFLTVLLVRPGLAIACINLFDMGLWGAWIALVVDQILRSGLVLLRYNSGKWKQIKI